jgi:peptide/nickel transport system permease protein
MSSVELQATTRLPRIRERPPRAGVGRALDVASSPGARRLISSAFAIFSVVTVLFFVSRVISDPARRMLDIGASQEQRDELTASLGLDEPLLTQYRQFLSNMVRLDFGDSLWQQRPAMSIVLEQLGSSLVLVALATLFSVVIYVPLGVWAALNAGRPLDKVLTTISLSGVSLPQFWLGQILILLFAVKLGWLPSFGAGSVQQLILPVATLTIVAGGRLLHVTRSVMIEQLGSNYVRTARSKGFEMRYVVRRHVLRNIAIPVITVVAWDFADILAGNVIMVETVFGRPGIGSTLIDAIDKQDVVLIDATVFVIAIIVVTTNALADVLYAKADPRLWDR